jgi:hypothetical protein
MSGDFRCTAGMANVGMFIANSDMIIVRGVESFL